MNSKEIVTDAPASGSKAPTAHADAETPLTETLRYFLEPSDLYDILKEKGAPNYRFYYANVEKAEALDPQRVKFTFSTKENRELPVIMGQLPVLPKHFWQGKKFDEPSLDVPLGSGPYRISQVEPGRRLVFERVKDWWGEKLPVNRGKYNFDRVEVEFYRDSNVAFEGFKAGEFDFYIEHQAKNWANGYRFPAIARGEVIRHRHGGRAGAHAAPDSLVRTRRWIGVAVSHRSDDSRSISVRFPALYARRSPAAMAR